MVVPGGRFNTRRKVSRIRFVTPVSFAVRFHKDNISSCKIISIMLLNNKQENSLNRDIKIEEDILSLCNGTANYTRVTNLIQNNFRIVLNLPPGTTIEYKIPNNDSMAVQRVQVQDSSESVSHTICDSSVVCSTLP